MILKLILICFCIVHNCFIFPEKILCNLIDPLVRALSRENCGYKKLLRGFEIQMTFRMRILLAEYRNYTLYPFLCRIYILTLKIYLFLFQCLYSVFSYPYKN